MQAAYVCSYDSLNRLRTFVLDQDGKLKIVSNEFARLCRNLPKCGKCKKEHVVPCVKKRTVFETPEDFQEYCTLKTRGEYKKSKRRKIVKKENKKINSENSRKKRKLSEGSAVDDDIFQDIVMPRKRVIFGKVKGHFYASDEPRPKLKPDNTKRKVVRVSKQKKNNVPPLL